MSHLVIEATLDNTLIQFSNIFTMYFYGGNFFCNLLE